MLKQADQTNFEQALKAVGDHGTLLALQQVWAVLVEQAGGVEGQAEQAEADRQAELAAVQTEMSALQARQAALTKPMAAGAPGA